MTLLRAYLSNGGTWKWELAFFIFSFFFLMRLEEARTEFPNLPPLLCVPALRYRQFSASVTPYLSAWKDRLENDVIGYVKDELTAGWKRSLEGIFNALDAYYDDLAKEVEGIPFLTLWQRLIDTGDGILVKLSSTITREEMQVLLDYLTTEEGKIPEDKADNYARLDEYRCATCGDLKDKAADKHNPIVQTYEKLLRIRTQLQARTNFASVTVDKVMSLSPENAAALLDALDDKKSWDTIEKKDLDGQHIWRAFEKDRAALRLEIFVNRIALLWNVSRPSEWLNLHPEYKTTYKIGAV